MGDTSKKEPLSPRQLRRTKTVDEIEMERSSVKIRRIKSNSEGLSRRRHPERKAKHLLKDLQALPRPRSPSMSAEYLDALENISQQTPGNERKIARLTQRPDLSAAIAEAFEKNSIEPLVIWPERLWPKRAYRRLLIDPETKELREDHSLFVRLLAAWMQESRADTYLREDTGGGKRMFIAMVDALDNWIPNPDQDLFKQCIIHSIHLPYPLARILRMLRRAVPALKGDMLLAALMLNCYLPRANVAGCEFGQIKVAMQSCFSPPQDMAWMLEKALAALASTKKHNKVHRKSLEN